MLAHYPRYTGWMTAWPGGTRTSCALQTHGESAREVLDALAPYRETLAMVVPDVANVFTTPRLTLFLLDSAKHRSWIVKRDGRLECVIPPRPLGKTEGGGA